MSDADAIVAAAERLAEKRARSGVQHRIGKAKRAHKKRHGENRDRAHMAIAKTGRIKKKRAAVAARVRAVKDAVAAYWRGDVADLSDAIQRGLGTLPLRSFSMRKS